MLSLPESSVKRWLSVRLKWTPLWRKKTDVIGEPQNAAQLPDMATSLGVKFSGYTCYGTHFQGGGQKYVGVDGSHDGASAIGHLNSEGNGGESQLSRAFRSDNGVIWDISVMIDRWSDEVNLKRTYASITNVPESNPNTYIWADRDPHRRSQQGISDYFWMNHDGQDAEVKNFDIDGVQSDVAAIATAESCSPEVMENEVNPSHITCTSDSGTGGKDNYVVTSEIRGMKVGPLDPKTYASYGFSSEAVEDGGRLKAQQGIFVLSHTNDSGVSKVIARYSDNPDNSVYSKADDLTTAYVSFEGSHEFTRQARVEYLLAFRNYDNNTDKSDNRKNYGAIVCPMYLWNDVHSTQLEAGHQRVDYDNGGDDHGQKLTLSQNMLTAMGSEFCPILHFCVTGDRVDNDRTMRVNGTQDETLDDFDLGAMWEVQF